MSLAMMGAAMPNVATASPWYAGLQNAGIALADRLSESVVAVAGQKINKELARHTMTNLDSSLDQNVNAKNEAVKGQDSDGGTLTNDFVEVGGMKIKSQTVKYIGGASAVLLLGLIALKMGGK